MEFDHRDETTKSFSVSTVLSNGYAWTTIQKEIEKCDVRCVKCHRIKTAKQKGWFRFLHNVAA